MIEKVKERCPEGTETPSKALVRLQFAPRNKYTQRALSFTGKFQLHYKIQVCADIHDSSCLQAKNLKISQGSMFPFAGPCLQIANSAWPSYPATLTDWSKTFRYVHKLLMHGH